MRNTENVKLAVFVVILCYIIAVPMLPRLLCQYDLVRHTPGFPENVNTSSISLLLEDFIKTLESKEVDEVSISQAQDMLRGLASEGVVDEDIARAAEGYATPAIDLWSEINMIKNDFLRQTLQNTFYKWTYSKITYEELAGITNTINSMYARGEISYEDYLRALKISRRLTELTQINTLAKAFDGIENPSLKRYLENAINMYSSGAIRSEELTNYLRNALDMYTLSPRDYEALLKAIEELSLGNSLLRNMDSMWSEGVLDVVKSASPSYPEHITANVISSSIPSVEIMPENIIPELNIKIPSLLPSVRAPSIGLPSIGFPSISPSTLIAIASVVLCVAVLVILARYRSKLGSILRSILPTHRAATKRLEEAGEGLPKIVKLYWSAVAFIESRLREVKGASETHREFLSKVKPKLKEIEKAFEDITFAYELYRFGGEAGSDIEKLADEGYRTLVSRS